MSSPIIYGNEFVVCLVCCICHVSQIFVPPEEPAEVKVSSFFLFDRSCKKNETSRSIVQFCLGSTTKQTRKRGKKTDRELKQTKTIYQIDQNIHYVGAGTQQPAEIPNLKPAVSDFVREYLLRNSHTPWVLNCLTNPSSCDKGSIQI